MSIAKSYSEESRWFALLRLWEGTNIHQCHFKQAFGLPLMRRPTNICLMNSMFAIDKSVWVDHRALGWKLSLFLAPQIFFKDLLACEDFHPNPFTIPNPLILIYMYIYVCLSVQNYSMVIWNSPRQTPQAKPAAAKADYGRPRQTKPLWYLRCYQRLWCIFQCHPPHEIEHISNLSSFAWPCRQKSSNGKS